jgi:hypothetical protein
MLARCFEKEAEELAYYAAGDSPRRLVAVRRVPAGRPRAARRRASARRSRPRSSRKRVAEPEPSDLARARRGRFRDLPASLLPVGRREAVRRERPRA